MYEWIPMKFELKFFNSSGRECEYFVRANDITRRYFTTYTGGCVGNNSYPLEALMDRLQRFGGTINGLSMEELNPSDDADVNKIDISSLL